MKNEAIIYEIVDPDLQWRQFVIDREPMVRMLVESFDRDSVAYAVYRAKVAPLSHDRWAKLLSQLSFQRREEVPFFFNAELLVSSEQSVLERVRFWSGGECHLRVVEG